MAISIQLVRKKFYYIFVSFIIIFLKVSEKCKACLKIFFKESLIFYAWVGILYYGKVKNYELCFFVL